MDCPFTVLRSATPLFTGIRDNFALMALIKPQPTLNQNSQWHDLQEERYPFVVPDDHPAAILRLTSAAFAAYVLTLQDSVGQGRRLEQIWSQFLICRRYTSDAGGD
jgi:hypothetical protein